MSELVTNPQQEGIVNAPIDVPLKVIAGAGTGKTETLTRRFIYLVTHYGISPEHILAVTFTEKATAEMMARIRGALARAGQPVEGRLSVFTFHGFAGTLLREFAELANLSPDFEVLSKVQQMLLLKRIFRDALADRIDKDGLRASELATLDVANLDAVLKLSAEVITKAKGNRWTPDALRERIEDTDEAVYRLLPDAVTAGSHSSKKGDLTQLIYGNMSDEFKCKDWEVARENGGELAVRKLYYTETNKKLEDTVVKSEVDADIATQRAQSAAMARTLVALFRRYNEALRERNALDFDDMIMMAAGLLETNEEAARACRERYSYILVDEFQDTSPAQMDLIRTVVTESGCPSDCARKCFASGQRPANITIVGDKKQAIYGFRNARRDNLDILLPCENDACGEVRRNLATNYRSTPEVIALANLIGKRIEPCDEELREHRTDEGLVHVPPIFERGKAKVNKTDEAKYIAERIQSLVDPKTSDSDKRTSYKDIAVLLRASAKFGALRKQFRERNIPYVCAGAVGLFEEPTAKDALACLRVAASRDDDDASLYRLLSRPPVSLSDRELLALRFEDPSAVSKSSRPLADGMAAVEDERYAALSARIASLRDSAHSLPLSELIDALPALAGFEDAWSEDDRDVWPQIRAVLVRATEDAAAMFAAPTIDDLLDLIDIYESDDGAWPDAPPLDVDGVRVMTVHASKGLEFPVVFVPSINKSSKPETGWLWDDEWGLLPAFAEQDSIKTKVARWLRLRKEITEDEEDRCWYVAATRARDELVVTGVKSGTAKETDKIRKSALPIDFFERKDDEYDPADWATVVHVRTRAARLAPSQVTRGQAVRQGVSSASYSALGTFKFCPVAAYIQRTWRLPSWLEERPAGTGVRRSGELVHLCAARYYLSGAEGLPNAVFAPTDDSAVRDRVARLWTEFLGSECAGWRPVAVERALSIRFNTPFGPLDITGFADVVLPDGDGFIVADIKTSDSEGADAGRYAPQMCLYRMALREEGLDVSETGKVILIDRSGLRVEQVSLPEHEGTLESDFNAYAAMFACGSMPDAPENASCAACWNSAICPKKKP